LRGSSWERRPIQVPLFAILSLVPLLLPYRKFFPRKQALGAAPVTGLVEDKIQQTL